MTLKFFFWHLSKVLNDKLNQFFFFWKVLNIRHCLISTWAKSGSLFWWWIPFCFFHKKKTLLKKRQKQSPPPVRLPLASGHGRFEKLRIQLYSWYLMFVSDNWLIMSLETWLWRWLSLRLSRRQSPSTVHNSSSQNYAHPDYHTILPTTNIAKLLELYDVFKGSNFRYTDVYMD